jgi:hypothetical protein
MARRRTSACAALAMVTALTTFSTADDANGFRVRMAASRHALVVQRALEGAQARLERTECQRIFTDFNDQDGRPLQERLDTLRLSGPQFLRYVGFYDGYGQRRCGDTKVLAFTLPRSLAVRVCPQVGRQDRQAVELILIHEMLHALGLGENPPSSYRITQQVTRRCGGRAETPRIRTATR